MVEFRGWVELTLQNWGYSETSGLHLWVAHARGGRGGEGGTVITKHDNEYRGFTSPYYV